MSIDETKVQTWLERYTRLKSAGGSMPKADQVLGFADELTGVLQQTLETGDDAGYQSLLRFLKKVYRYVEFPAKQDGTEGEYAFVPKDVLERVEELFLDLFRERKKEALQSDETVKDFSARYQAVAENIERLGRAVQRGAGGNGEVTEEFARMWEKVSLNEEVLRRGYAAVWELRKEHITLLSRGKEDVVPVFEEGGFPAWLKDENADMLVLGLPSPKRITGLLSELLDKARREGLLALEDDLYEAPYPKIIRDHIQLVVDGTDPVLVRESLAGKFARLKNRLREIEDVVQKLAVRFLDERVYPSLAEYLFSLEGLKLFGSVKQAGDSDEFGLADEEEIKPLESDFSEDENREYGELRSLLEFFGCVYEDKRREGINLAIEEAHEGNFLYKKIMYILKQLYPEMDAVDAALNYLFRRAREELSIAEKVLETGILGLQAGVDFPKQLSGWIDTLYGEVELPERLMQVSDFCSGRLEKPENVYIAIEDCIKSSSDLHALSGDLIPHIEDDEIRGALEKAKRSAVQIGTLHKDKGVFAGGADFVLGRKEKRTRSFLSEDIKAQDTLKEKLRQTKKFFAVEEAKRHPTFRNIHLLTDRSQLEQLAVELMGMYIDRRKKTEEFNKKLEEEYSRELQKRCETILDILPETEISAENEGAFEMELVHQFFSRSPYRLAEIVDSNFDKKQAEEYLYPHLFVFENIVLIDDRSIQKILREIDVMDLAKALKGAEDEVQEKIYRNMSRRAETLLKEDIEYMGPIRKGDVMESREKIVNIIFELEERGDITIARSGDDEMLV